MLTLSMLLALRRLFSQTKQGINKIPSEESENRRDAKRPRFKVKKKNLERISRIERRLDVWEDVDLSLSPRAMPDDSCLLHQCASSTQTNDAAPQAAAAMQTESVVLCSLAVQTQWIAMPTTMQKLHAERPDQRDSSLQTELLGISISVQTETLAASGFPIERIDVSLQTERDEKSVYIQTEHRVFVFHTVSMQTEPVEKSERAFQTESVNGKHLGGFDMTKLPAIEVQKPVKVALKFITVPTQTTHYDQCDVALQTGFLGKSVSMQTDSRVLVLQTNWVQTEPAAMCNLAVQTDCAGEICEKVATQEFAAQTDASGQRDAAMQIEFHSNDIGLQTEMPQTDGKVQSDEANQTEFVGDDASVQTERPALSNLAMQTDGLENRDAAMQTNVSGIIGNKEFTTQTEEVLKCNIALQTMLVDSQSTEMQTERPELPNLATQTDNIERRDAAMLTDVSGMIENNEFSTQTEEVLRSEVALQTLIVGSQNIEVQTESPELPDLATQTDMTVYCDMAFQTDFIGNDASVQTVQPVLPNLATQTDFIALCDTAFQTEILSNDVSTQTERPTHPEFSSQTETADNCNISVQTEFNGRDISVQTQSAASPAKTTQTTSTVSCDSCLQTAFDTRSISCQTEKCIMPTFSTQTEHAVFSDAGLQTDFVGNTVASQTVPQTRPTFSMQTARVIKSDSFVQTEFAGRNVSVQTIKPFLPTLLMHTAKAVRFGSATQTEFLANDVSIQTERPAVPYLSKAPGVDEKPILRSELIGICASMQTEVLTLPSFSTQTDLVVKSDSCLQTEVSQRSVAIQTIKPRSPTFSVQTEQIERQNRSSQTDLVDRSISLPNFSIAKENRSCQTDFQFNGRISAQNFVSRTQSFDSLERMANQSQTDLSGRSATSEIEVFDLKRIKTTYSTCTAEEQAHYLGTLAQKILKWHETTSYDGSRKSYADKVQAADKALLEIEQELRECPRESGKSGVLVSAKERINDYLQRLKTQRSKSYDIANKTL